MKRAQQFYIAGKWQSPETLRTLDVIDPATEESFSTIALGDEADVDRAVAAAKEAFPAYSRTLRQDRIALMQRILRGYRARYEDFATILSREMGAPIKFARDAQVAIGIGHLDKMLAVLEEFRFEELRGTTLILREPIGVCGLITPWNWPINQILCKVVPALAAGCTMVLKPSEVAPLNAIVLTEVLHDAGVPEGVFNLVNGDGPTVGEALARHPDVQMVSITGSTRAGVLVAKAAASTIKRVHQELGGKSANIILDDTDLENAVSLGVKACFRNSGQSCSAPTRMLVPSQLCPSAVGIAKTTAESLRVGPPDRDDTVLGPVVSQAQYDKIQQLIKAGIAEGATLVTGGLGRPEGFNRGYYVRPTVFSDVEPSMTISREEIFGPVLSILAYDSEDEAIEIANDTPYGLAAYIQSGDIGRARRVAAQMRSGAVHINYPAWDPGAPFGGYKQSGNGREYADFGLEAFLETKGVIGHGAS